MAANPMHEKVDRLLHDAEHAESGRMMAKMMRDTRAVAEFQAKITRLLTEANALDPHHAAPAWEEVNLRAEAPNGR